MKIDPTNKPNPELLEDVVNTSHFSIESSRYTWQVFTNGKKRLIRMTIDHIWESLSIPPFFKVHANHIVKLDQIEKVNNEAGLSIEMKNGSIVPISSEMILHFLK